MAAVAITDLRQHLGYLKPSDISRIEKPISSATRRTRDSSGSAAILHLASGGRRRDRRRLAARRASRDGGAAARDKRVMEDTEVSKQQITERFGKPVAELVDGLSKLDRVEFQSQADAQAENFRKMLLAMARDVRVILIKLGRPAAQQ